MSRKLHVGIAAFGLALLGIPALVQAESSDLSKLPSPAQTTISASLGRDSSGYFATRIGDGFVFANPDQQLRVHFTSQVAELRELNLSWNLSLQGFGYGDSIRDVRSAIPTAVANRVEYRRGAVTEWYVNGPVGIEQGFTLSERPTGVRGAPLTLVLSVSQGVRLRLDSDGKGLELSRGTGAQLRYTGLMAWDADGKQLDSWLKIDGDRLLVQAADNNAHYPVTIDPIIQLAQLTVLNGTNKDLTGYSVAVSGNTIVVGAPRANGGGNRNGGAVYLYVRPPSGWQNMVETAKLTGSSSSYLGYSVAVDGDTVVTFGIDVNTGENVVLVYVKPQGGWKSMTETADLTMSDSTLNLESFSSVAISGDTIVAGSALSDTFDFEEGEAYVYVKPASGWTSMSQTAILHPSDIATDNFGASVSVSGDVIVVGAPDHGNIVGAAYVFVEPAGGWTDTTQTAVLTASDGQFLDQLGLAVSISGSTIVAGAPYATIGSHSDQGAAYVFTEPAGGWQDVTETAKLTTSTGTGYSQFGSAVAINGDSIAIGEPRANVGSNMFQGAVFVYQEPASGWTTTAHATTFVTAGSTDSSLGASVALGSHLIVAGAPVGYNGKIKAPGSTYLFGWQ